MHLLPNKRVCGSLTLTLILRCFAYPPNVVRNCGRQKNKEGNKMKSECWWNILLTSTRSNYGLGVYIDEFKCRFDQRTSNPYAEVGGVHR